MKNIYEPSFVENLFDKMSSSYAKMNYITSFGFSERWRRQCVNSTQIKKAETVVDLMTGMGECWKHILSNSNQDSKLIGLDFSSEMIQYAKLNTSKFKFSKIELLKENVFNNSIPNETADVVISGFGLKTFNDEQLKSLAKEVHRILKPNGRFSFIEISVPQNVILRFFFMFYVKYIIPVLGKLFLGNPETYKMLGVYTEEFKNSKQVFEIFKHENFEIEYIKYFFGCATGIKGLKVK